MKNIVFCCLLALIVLCSCKATRDGRAYTRVVSNPALAERVFRTLEMSHPIKIDSFTRYINGKEMVVYDTVFTKENIPVNNIVYVKTPVMIPYSVTKTVTRIDTAYVSVRDLRQENLLNKDLNTFRGMYDQQGLQLSQLKKSGTKKTIIIMGLGLLLLFSIYVYIRKK